MESYIVAGAMLSTRNSETEKMKRWGQFAQGTQVSLSGGWFKLFYYLLLGFASESYFKLFLANK